VDPTIRAQIRKDVEIAIRARIDEKGQVTRAEAVSHDGTAGGYLEAAAINAMLKWRFAPARLGDKAVPSEQTVTFVFGKE